MLKMSVGALMFVVALTYGGMTVASSAQEMLDQADLAWSKDDLAGAEALFLQAVEQAEDGQPAARLAGFYLGQNRLEEAVERFQQAISAGLPTPPIQARAFVDMGIAYLHLGRSALSEAALEEALRIDPSRETEIRPLLERLKEDS